MSEHEFNVESDIVEYLFDNPDVAVKVSGKHDDERPAYFHLITDTAEDVEPYVQVTVKRKGTVIDGTLVADDNEIADSDEVTVVERNEVPRLNEVSEENS